MIDFRSDTVTKPTQAMRDAMAGAVVGDDVYQDDPTIQLLENSAAELCGKEAALFVPSGTMGNQVAIMSHTNRGDEIIVGSHSHIKNYEVGAAAVLASVSYHLVPEKRGMMDVDKIEAGIREKDIHYPTTSLICIENAHGTGVVGSLSYMERVYALAQKNHLKVHLDGARVFNAATFLNTPLPSMTRYVDSLMFCLSKGLGSPIGSMLVGTKAFIERARKNRKMLGGGLRQVGVLGATGLISLNTMRHRLQDDHDNAAYLGKQLDQYDAFSVDFDALDINMVFVKSSIDMSALAHYMKAHDVLLGGYKGDYMRLVCHCDIKRDDIDYFLTLLDTYLDAK